jgi:hypothetical protein
MYVLKYVAASSTISGYLIIRTGPFITLLWWLVEVKWGGGGGGRQKHQL